jgi:hypothetical protein
MIPSPEAAAKLGVNTSRVRNMIRAKLLAASKIGGRWLVDPASIERRKSLAAPVGRLLTPQNAWATLFLAAGEGVQATPWLARLSPSGLSRIRSRLRREGLAPLVPRLRNRSFTLQLRAHPSDVARLAQEPGIVLAGVNAAPDYNIDISAPGVIEIYVAANSLSELVEEYYLEPSSNPNAILHVVEGFWPFSTSARLVPASVAAVDLIEAEDERSRRAGWELLRRLGQP